MSNEKKLIVKRLVIFLVISFLPFMILVPFLWAVYGEPLYASKNEELAVVSYLVGIFGMMIPSAANLLTRCITKEGFSEHYLGVHVKGKEGCWIASVTVKLLEGWLSLALLWTVYLPGVPFLSAFPGINQKNIGLYLLQLGTSIILFFPAFGEEWGWRGYMMPKLLKLMPKPAAIVLGGVIWGLWHAPLTIAGHNFGTEYPGYPFAGIGMMCLFCVLMNAFLTLVTERTRSIYPASFIHMINNNLSFMILLNLFESEAFLRKIEGLNSLELFFADIVLVLVTAVVSFLLFMKDSPGKRTQ